jgi:hypothetical protein
MTISRDSRLTVGLVTLVLLLSVPAALSSIQEPPPPPLSNGSAAPDGGQLLWEWMDRLAFEMRDQVAEIYEIPPETEAVFILAPLGFPGITSSEWNIIDPWVEAGGLLVVTGSSSAARHYGFNSRVRGVDELAMFSPFFKHPPVQAPINTRARNYLEPTDERQEFVPLLAHDEGLILVMIDQGSGRVVLSTTDYPFSNHGLQQAGSPELLINIFDHIPRQGSVWFDEWHHGKRLDVVQPTGPGDWLRFTPAGRSLLYIATVLFIGILLSGRRFGRPLRPADQQPRRAPLEYATALANLSRRAGHRAALLLDTADRVKRHFGSRYRIDPRVPDAAFLEQLTRFAPHLDIEHIRSLLLRLRRPNTDEYDMLQLSIEAADLMEEK